MIGCPVMSTAHETRAACEPAVRLVVMLAYMSEPPIQCERGSGEPRVSDLHGSWYRLTRVARVAHEPRMAQVVYQADRLCEALRATLTPREFHPSPDTYFRSRGFYLHMDTFWGSVAQVTQVRHAQVRLYRIFILSLVAQASF
jgi:hypothetical protein